ncbi:hypothetical protein VPH35_031622 [Triticum aestivum]
MSLRSPSSLQLAFRLLQLFCQPMSMATALRVSQDHCTSLWRSVTSHLALRGYSHTLRRAMTEIVPPRIFCEGARKIINREFVVATVPYTNRTHKVIFSTRTARVSGEVRFANFKKEHASEIVDPHHHQSVRVHAIGSKIIRAIRRGLSIKSKIEQRGGEPPHMATCLDWIDELNWEVIVAVHSKRAHCFEGGGKIIVFTGLLDHFSTDAEIATVIAHEVGHVIARHASEMIQIFRLWFPTDLLVAPLLRRNELEADYIGMMLLAAAGFDPHAAPLFFGKAGRMDGESALTDLLSFFPFRTHPSMRRRAWLLSHPKVMEEAMEIYREATGDGPHNQGFGLS